MTSKQIGARKKAGAKPKPAAEKRTKKVHVSLSASSAEVALQHMQRLNISQSEYIRRALAEFHAHLDRQVSSKAADEPMQQPSRVLVGCLLPAEHADAVAHARSQGLHEMSEHVRRAMTHFRQLEQDA